jgi:hypothetical protein
MRLLLCALILAVPSLAQAQWTDYGNAPYQYGPGWNDLSAADRIAIRTRQMEQESYEMDSIQAQQNMVKEMKELNKTMRKMQEIEEERTNNRGCELCGYDLDWLGK